MIKSIKNEKIKQLLKLSQYKKVRKAHNVFVLEGLRLINDAINFQAKLINLFLTERAIKNFQLKQINLDNYTITTISEKVAAQISNVQHNQGCFAICAQLNCLSLNSFSMKNGNFLLLLEINNPGNLGTLFRSAAAFNFNNIILADCCEIYNPKTIRSSMSAIFKLKFVQCSVSAAKKWLKSCPLTSYAAVVSQDAESLTRLNTKKNGHVIVIGSEANGLNLEVTQLCTKKVTIKMQSKIESLNVAVAGSILMFHLSQKQQIIQNNNNKK